MNILYRQIIKTVYDEYSPYDRYVFYQHNFYDNIYFFNKDAKYIGFTNYTLETDGSLNLRYDYIPNGSSIKDIKYWFEINPDKHRAPVLDDYGILIGEYFDSDYVGKCLYQNIEDKALEVALCFKSEFHEWASSKIIQIVGNDEYKIMQLLQLIPNGQTKHDSNENIDYIIDLDLCPDFRQKIDKKNKLKLSVSEILLPLLIKILVKFVRERGVDFYIFDGIKKKELKNLTNKEYNNINSAIETILQDSEYMSLFAANDFESESLLLRHKQDLDKHARFVSNGIHNILIDSKEQFLNIENGIRCTSNSPSKPQYLIHMYGPCVVYGLCVADSHTIASNLQRFINQTEYAATKIINHGLSYGKDLLNDLLYIMATPLSSGDSIIWFSGFSEKEIAIFKSLGVTVTSLKDCICGFHNWFLNNPFHCNAAVNRIYAKEMCKKIMSRKIKKGFSNKQSIIDAYKIPLAYDSDAILHSGQLDKYIQDIARYRIPNQKNNKIGCVVLNANPCTKGHIYLVNEALKRVGYLYVFLVQESSLGYSYLDREYMLKQELGGLNNITIIPGGDIFTSAISFPEYFHRSTSCKISPILNHKIFCERIAPTLNIKIRFFGEEPMDKVTYQLNETAKSYYPNYGIEVCILPRLKYGSKYISAKDVREYIRAKDYEHLFPLLGLPTFNYIKNNICQ